MSDKLKCGSYEMSFWTAERHASATPDIDGHADVTLGANKTITAPTRPSRCHGVTVTSTLSAPAFATTVNTGALAAETTCPPVTVT